MCPLESHLLSRYVGLSKQSPKLGKPGSGQWEKIRAKAEQAALDYAAELLRFQATREIETGYNFGEDHPWQQEFEQTFPFRETPDQVTAIQAVKEDMQKKRPMDRLVCGDVGFGKTEGCNSRSIPSCNRRQTSSLSRTNYSTRPTALQYAT